MQTCLEPGGVDEKDKPEVDRSTPQAESAIGKANPLPSRVVRDPLKWGV